MIFIVFDNEFITIKVTPHYDYVISIDQVIEDEKSKRLDWLWHLNRKTWFNKDLEKSFKEIMAGHGVHL